jgi:hypothetical protein
MARRPLNEKLLSIFGDIKVFRWPAFILYQPQGYAVKGEDVRVVLETVQPGDILLRGFYNYLDGYFIPGYFSHVGLYVGDVGPEDQAGVVETGAALRCRRAPRFETGRQKVIHAIAEGVILEDVISFCRCDYMAIMRFPEQFQRSASDAHHTVVRESGFNQAELEIHRRLETGDVVTSAEVIPIVKAAALGKLGARYDFNFDFSRFDRVSCSELVYYAAKCAAPFLGVQAENRRVLFFRRSMIVPDAFAAAPLHLVWASRSVNTDALARLRPDAARSARARGA